MGSLQRTLPFFFFCKVGSSRKVSDVGRLGVTRRVAVAYRDGPAAPRVATTSSLVSPSEEDLERSIP